MTKQGELCSRSAQLTSMWCTCAVHVIRIHPVHMVHVSDGNVISSCQTSSTMINAIVVYPGLQASSLLSGSDLIPAQFVLLSAYIELASGKELYMTQNNVHGFNYPCLKFI